MAPPLLPIATLLLAAAQAGATKPPAPIVVPASVPLAAMCNDPDVHCIFTAKGITVEGAGIIKIKHYEPGNSVWMLSSEPANGTAHGCGGSSIGWRFNEDGWFLQYPQYTVANGGMELVETPDADLGLFCR